MQQLAISKEIKLYKKYNTFETFKSILSIFIFMLVILISFIFYSKASFAMFTIGGDISTKEWLKFDKDRNLKNSDFNNFVLIELTPYDISKWSTGYQIGRDKTTYDFKSGIASSSGFGYIDNALDKEFQRLSNIVKFNSTDYYIGYWVYFPKLGKYLRYVAFVNGTFEEQTPENIKYKEQKLNFEKLFSIKIDGFQRTNIKDTIWMMQLGYNCCFDVNKKEQKIKCYNELDTSDYNRYIYVNGNYPDGLKMQDFEDMFNAKLYGGLKGIRDKNTNKKILIMVWPKGAKEFIKMVKKLPDNYMSNIQGGYVWFLSEPVSGRAKYGAIKKGFKYSKYDVKPNSKYDAELSRISGGKLKAKYGRYLTKERYSEDYVAPSIYGNNYNDKPEW